MAANQPLARLSDDELFDWLRLVRSENVGPRTFRALIDRCGGARAALEALPELARRGGARRPITLAAPEEIDRELATARRLGVRFAVGVLAGGHAKPYPSEAVPLIERIVEFGAVVSEMPIGQEPRGRDFPRRNRIVSGLSLATIVVEAARGSGSLITARFALEQNRQVFAVPGSPLDPRAEGTNDLLKQGATICTSAEDVATALEPMRSRDLFSTLEEGDPSEPPRGKGRSPMTPRAAPSDDVEPGGLAEVATDRLDAIRDRIAALLGPSPIGFDDLARAAEASARETRVALMELELAGRIEFSGGGRVAAKIAAEFG